MNDHAPSPQTTLAILLGASAWPHSPDFHGSAAFDNVARGFRAYLLNPRHFGLPEENFCDLFDTEQGPDKIDRSIRSFLDQRTSAMRQMGNAPRDLLFYFVGHGGFAGRKSEYYLAVRCTSSEYPGASGIRIESLATTLMDKARYLRRYIILDCCYAAAAFTDFQAEGPAQVAVRQAVDAFTDRARRIGKGTSLLCSSGKNHKLTPHQVDGDVAVVPFFPNPVAVGRETLIDPARRDFSDRQLGNYRLVRSLGEGGFAEVYLGEHVHLGTQAAIKVLHTQLTRGDIETFRAEARTIAHLEHQHIVRVLDYGVADKTPYLVMSYAPGGTLRQHHPRGTRIPLPTIVTYVNQLADALQYAHEQKLIHRDVKPENMLMGRHNEVLLSDFGIAVIAHSPDSQRVEPMAGTIPYTAPEQIQGHPRPASDQYSLGVVVYEWLCGDQPFQGNLTEVALQHTMTPAPPFRQKGVEIPPEVEQVVMIALAKDPGQRFASVRAFARALEQACLPTPSPVIATPSTLPADQPAPVVTPPAPLRSPRPPIISPGRLSRRTVLVGGIGLASLAVVGGGVFAGVELASKPPPRGTLFHTFPQDYSVRAVAWSPDGTHLASADENKEVKIWDTASGAYVFTYSDANASTVYAVAWSPDGKYIASGSDDNMVQVWDATTGARHLAYGKHTSYVYAVAWSPDGTRIASGSADYTVQVWSPSASGTSNHYSEHTDAVQAVAWSSDGQHLASGSADKTVRVRDLSANRNTTYAIYVYSGHTDIVYTVAWSPGGFPWPWSHEGQRLASGGRDTTVRLWQAV